MGLVWDFLSQAVFDSAFLPPPVSSVSYRALLRGWALRPDMRSGFNGLAAKAQQVIGQDPFGSSLFLFRSKRGDYFVEHRGFDPRAPCGARLCHQPR